jgi:hypothetical protein
MALMIGKILLASILISVVSWVSGKKGELAGFLTALPLTSMLALAFSQMEWRDSANSVAYAKSVFLAVPVSLLFFIPFLFAQRLNWGFWGCYIGGIALLGIGYFGHSWISKAMGS